MWQCFASATPIPTASITIIPFDPPLPPFSPRKFPLPTYPFSSFQIQALSLSSLPHLLPNPQPTITHKQRQSKPQRPKPLPRKMDNTGSRAEAERWLYTANKLLSARDLHGARSFAVRARESDPTFDASELLLAVIDTLLSGETQINGLHDWYSILQILPYTHNIEYIASQYRRLALLLDPHRNPFAFSSHAFTLVHDAWSVLSNPAKKAMYDNELRLVTAPPPAAPSQQPVPVASAVHVPTAVPVPNLTPTPNPAPVQRQQQKSPAKRGPKPKDRAGTGEQRPNPNIAATEPTTQARTSDPVESETGSSFWTACPYCYVMYEYPTLYEDCTLRCQSCRRGFHAMKVRTPPMAGKDSYYCCWGFFPLGFSGDFKDISGTNSKWNPFSAMFACPLKGGGGVKSARGSWVFHDDDATAAFIEHSDPSDDDSDDADWGSRAERAKKRAERAKKRARNKGKNSGNASGGDGKRAFSEKARRGSQSGTGHANLENGVVGEGGGSGVPNTARAELSKKAVNSSRRKGAGNLGKLDLNVEFSNEVEEPAPVVRDGNVAGNPEENIEGNAFFEGLDEFLNSLPILNVVADDKVKGH